jgi:hypothetical protein
MLFEDLKFVETNPDLIFCFDNVLDHSILDKVSNFDWNSLVPTRRRSNGFVKTYTFKIGSLDFLETMRDAGFSCFQTMDTSARLTSVSTFLFGLSENDGRMTRAEIHPDSFETGGKWTMLYHLDGNSGSTDFYNNSVKNTVVKSIEFKPGRLIIFPGIYRHRGSIPNNGTRLVVNIRCEFDTKLNEDILKYSPMLQQRYQQEYINSVSCDNLLLRL